MPNHGLGPLAHTALDIRRRVLRHPAQVSHDPALWPGWWGEETALRAIAYLRDAGVCDDPIEAALLLVGCAFHDAETDGEITNLGGEVVMATKVLQGKPSDYPEIYWRELSEALPEHQLARGALQVALLDDALGWREQDRRRRKVVGDAVHRVLSMLTRVPCRRGAQLERLLVARLSIQRHAIAVE